jgi:serine/threonine-protein kinase
MAEQTLEDLLEADPRPSPEVAERRVRAILEALAPIHVRGMAHGDLKPGNVLVLDNGTVRLFPPVPLPPGDAFCLTPRYAAPEILFGEKPTAMSDIGALGVILYRMLSGALPFPQEDLRALFDGVSTAEPAPDGSAGADGSVRHWSP